MSGRRRRAALVVWMLVLVVGAVAVAVLAKGNADDERRDAAAAAATTRAESAVTELLSYEPGRLPAEMAQEKELMTQQFAGRYEQMISDSVLPTAQKQRIRSLARVNGSSVTRAADDTVNLLMFVDVATTTASSTHPKVSGSRLRVTMERVDDSWVVSDVESV